MRHTDGQKVNAQKMGQQICRNGGLLIMIKFNKEDYYLVSDSDLTLIEECLNSLTWNLTKSLKDHWRRSRISSQEVQELTSSEPRTLHEEFLTTEGF